MARVLIVDDDATTVRLLQTFLQMEGFQVSSAGRGADVLSAAQQVAPDLIMMDYYLVDTDAATLIRDLRQHATLKSIPIVVASGSNVEREALAAGASLFVLKPFEPAKLSTLLRSLVDGSTAKRE